MSFTTSLSLGLSLSMDAFAASVAQGARSRNDRLRQAVRTAFYFGLFEAVFPIIGWGLGLMLGKVMAQVDHWVAFLLLVGIGLKMIHDGLRPRLEPVRARPHSTGRIALLALGTSVDAAAVGVTLVVLGIPIVQAALVIGVTTFMMTCAGFLLGGLAGPRLPRFAEALGGLLLIAIGAKILLEHTVLSG